MLRLKAVQEPLANFLASGLLELREKLGPILWQFPPSMRFDPDRFASFFEALPRATNQARALARGCGARLGAPGRHPHGWQSPAKHRPRRILLL